MSETPAQPPAPTHEGNVAELKTESRWLPSLILVTAGSGLAAPMLGVGVTWRQDFTVSTNTLILPNVATVIGFLATAIGIAIAPSPRRTRAIAIGLLGVVGVAMLVRFIGDILAVDYGYAPVGFATVLGARLGGLLDVLLGGALIVGAAFVGLRVSGVRLLWLLLLLIPGLTMLLTPDYVIPFFVKLIVFPIIVLVSTLQQRSSSARIADREANIAIAREESNRTDLAKRAEEIRRWEEAYALAHNGEKPPAGFAPPVSFASGSKTNVFAVPALVFGILGSVLGIVFGHLSLSQIKRTGEGGRGLALAGLIVGYVQIGLVVLGGLIVLVLSAIRQ